MALGQTFHLDRLKYLLVLMLSLAGCAGGDGGIAGGAATLGWTAPSGRADGVTPIALTEIAGYNIYYKTAMGTYRDHAPIYIDDSNNVANVQVSIGAILVQPGAYLIVVTTVDIDGRESVFSAPEVEVTF